jgi:hypothetical protein|tara:strand:- start:1434 stop:1802 length:369 start_codon:yes stop_codon:yes gene_type:complete
VRKKKVKTKRRKIIKPKKSKKVVKVIPLNEKILADDISKYPYVEIEWLDIEGDDGWSTLKILNQEKLPIAVSKGYLLSQKKGVTRIFRDYIKSKTKPVFEDIGSTVIIPTSVIISIKKIVLD